MNTTAFPRLNKQKLVLTAGLACAVALGTTIIANGHSLVNPIAIASKGCKMISKTMTAGDIDAILAGTSLHLDNPDGGYCFNAPTVASSK
ncbi:hypothetical protein PZF67_004544 [Pseudomonas aeruginosa]|uniref:hypothetical protein n=1 Tax=Pseudomonas aeruginosa TaxID=287 RepID=UPI0025CAA332|nr:hypothetical protein [Pseudomonas aeruginosa]